MVQVVEGETQYEWRRRFKEETDTPEAEITTAYHEAGHAVVGYIFKRLMPYATIIPKEKDDKGQVLGEVLQRKRRSPRLVVARSKLPDGSTESHLQWPKKSERRRVAEAKSEILFYMAGGAAELVHFNKNSWQDGMGSDIEHAREVAGTISQNKDVDDFLREGIDTAVAILRYCWPYYDAVGLIARKLLLEKPSRTPRYAAQSLPRLMTGYGVRAAKIV